jgi:DNA modification methylase
MRVAPTQLPLPIMGVNSVGSPESAADQGASTQSNKLDPDDRRFHDWYRFVLSFPPHLVRTYIRDFGLDASSVVLDPFCGTGTTLVEAKLNGLASIGLETNPFASFASSVKINWQINPEILVSRAREIGHAALSMLNEGGIRDDEPFGGNTHQTSLRTLGAEAQKLILANSISPLPLHKTLVLFDCLQEHRREPYYGHALLALANALVFKFSNLSFGPEVGVGKPKSDAPVVMSWLAEVERIAGDLRLVLRDGAPTATVYLADARRVDQILHSQSIDAVITSPPYPNEKDYTRTTRLESVVLGFVSTKAELRAFKSNFIRSNTRGVYKTDDDDVWVARHPEVQRIAAAIECRRVDLGKTSGFERLYSKVTRLYFGGMARHLAGLRPVLRPGAHLAYVVGDQASYLRVLIRTGELLASIAQALGYEWVRTDLFRTQFSTTTKEQLREEVVVLRWPG